MAQIIHRSRWKRSPPPGTKISFSHPLSHGLWAAIYYSGATAFDALRGMPTQNFNPGNNQAQSRVYRGGRYFTANRPGGAPPYFFSAGRTLSLSTTSNITLVGLFGGDSRSTFPTLRAKLTSVYWQEGVPSVQEGDGTNNVPVARFYGAGNVGVQAVGSTPMPGANAAGRVIAAEYANGSGVAVWADGIKEGFTASTLALALVPDELHITSGGTIMEYPPIVLAYHRILSDGEHRALAENPFQVLRPSRSPTFYSLAGGAPTLVVDDITHAQAVDTIALGQVHQLATADATHAQLVDAVAVSQTHHLAVSDSTHAHPIDTLNLTQLHQLVVQDATHAHPTDAIALTQTHLMTVANILHAHALDHLSLSGVVTLAIQDMLHAQQADGLTLSTTATLQVDDILHTQALDGLSLGGSATLQIANVLHAHAADAVALGQVHVLVVSDAIHAQLVDAVALSLPGAVLAGERALVIPTETRALVVVAESRALAIAAEIRALTIH